MNRRGGVGARFPDDSFEAAALLETHVQVSDQKWAGLELRLGAIEAGLDRLERRLWLAVWGVVAFVLTRGVMTLLEMAGSGGAG